MSAVTRSEPGVVDRAVELPDDDLDHAGRRRHTMAWISGLAALLALSIPLTVGIGPVGIPPLVVTKIAGHHLFSWPEQQSWPSTQDAIVWQVRAPRVLLGVVVGAGLAMAGVALQAMVRNVLADPYILGVTSGASTGAAASILFGVGSALGASSLTGSAFAGALLASIAVFVLARSSGKVTSTRLLLAGVAVGYLLSATTSFLIFASDSPEGARPVLFWLLGSLSLARWSTLAVASVAVLACGAVLLLWGRRLDALAIGDATARALGVHPDRFRIQALIVVSLGVGAVVAVSGGIGFVGLIVPHIARLCVGGAHRRVVPVAALIGAVFLIWADVAARVAFSPRELPLGIVTAVVGAPFLFILVRRFQTGTPS
jgi:iron complex transport system permease protein